MHVLLHLTTQFIFQSRSQYCHLCVLTQRVIRRRTPYHVDVRVQLVEEVVNLLQLTHEDRMFVTRVDVKQDTLRLADVVAIE